MRNAFAAELTALAADDKRLVLLSGDIGNRLFDDFKGRFPDRFYNCGVAEANLTGVAAGLALSGFKPFTYSIASFITTRCLEQIKIDLCYHNLPVVIVGVGAGLAYTNNGATHESCEDIAFLRAIPNMTIICPGDSVETRLALNETLTINGPVYLRLGKKNEPVVHETDPDFTAGRVLVLREGSDLCLISTGNMLYNSMEAARLLEDDGISACVVSMHTVKPIDKDLVAAIFNRFKLAVTVEEHSRIGGLGSAVLEFVNDYGIGGAKLLRIGIPDMFFDLAGDQRYKRECFGLSPEAIARRALQELVHVPALQLFTLNGQLC